MRRSRLRAPAEITNQFGGGGIGDEGRLARESALVLTEVPYTPLHDSTPEPSPPLRCGDRSTRIDEVMIDGTTADGSALTAGEQ